MTSLKIQGCSKFCNKVVIKPFDNVVATLSQPCDKVEARLCRGCEKALWQPRDNVRMTMFVQPCDNLSTPFNNLTTVSKYKVVSRLQKSIVATLRQGCDNLVISVWEECLKYFEWRA